MYILETIRGKDYISEVYRTVKTSPEHFGLSSMAVLSPQEIDHRNGSNTVPWGNIRGYYIHGHN